MGVTQWLVQGICQGLAAKPLRTTLICKWKEEVPTFAFSFINFRFHMLSKSQVREKQLICIKTR